MAHAGRCLLIFVSNSRTSPGCIKRKFVRYIEANHVLACQSCSETTLKLAPMRLLHNDQIGPADQFSGERVLGLFWL